MNSRGLFIEWDVADEFAFPQGQKLQFKLQTSVISI
jgi:hypothetical protein